MSISTENRTTVFRILALGRLRRGGKMRRALLVLAAAAGLTLVASGVALAASITCPNAADNYCTGTKKIDTLTGSSGPDNMSARGGDDTLFGLGGDDNAMRGDSGRDKLYGGPGTDHLGGGTGTDVLEGGDGFDHYIFDEDNWGKETIVDTPIVDADVSTAHWVRFDGVTEDLTIDMNSRAEPEVRRRDGTLTSTLDWENDLIDGVIDGEGDDLIIGRLVADNIQTTRGGVDRVNARSGDDFIYTVDNTVDSIECGDGTDEIRKDAEDIATNCESVTNL